MAKKRMYLNGQIVEVDEEQLKNRTYNDLTKVYPSTTEEIAPVKTTTTTKSKNTKAKEKQWYETIVEKPKAFDDGYNVGEIAGTILGSTADAGLNALEGIFRVGEGIAMTAAGIIVEGIDAFNGGESEYTKGVRRRISGEDGSPPLTRLTQWLEDQISDYSIFGQTGDEVFSGIGYTYGMLEGGKAIPGGGNVELAVGNHVARLPILSAVGGTSSGFQKAYQNGATGTQALAKAFGSGAIESITESLFGFMGIGGNDITDQFAKNFTSKFSSGVAQNLAKVGVSSTAEGLEEVISSASNQFLDKMIDRYSGENDPKFYEKLNPDELAQEFVTTFLSTAITGGYDSVTNINHLTNNAIDNFEKEAGRQLTVAEKTSIRDQVARAFANENTLNEQMVIDNEMNSRLAELGEYTRADRNRIRNEINQDLEKGRISVDSIEKTLPGISDQWNAQFNELKELQDEIKSSEGAEKDYLIGQYEQKLQEYKQDDRLRNSYVEEVNKGRTFNYNDESLTELAKSTYQSAMESGMDNTKATHDLVEFASKLADYTGVNIKFTTNDYLKNIPSIADKMTENTVVNGANVKNENTIYVNKDSTKNLYTIIGHEVGHLLDDAKEGAKIRKFAEKYANSKGEYFDRYSKLSKNYNENEISTEMANDIIGEYLFTDEDFVSKLATEHPSTFKKVYDWFQHIFKLATSGSKEARQLEKVRYNLEKGLAEINVEKSNEMEYNKATNEEAKLQKSSELARTVFPEDVTVDDLINDDTRKGKFKDHSDSVEYFKLDYDVMQEINAIVSTKAHKSVSGDDLSFTQKIGADNQTYTIYADVLSDDNYSITNAELLREDVVQDVNERIEKQNNGSLVENEGYEQGESSIDIKSNERGEGIGEISGVSGEQQGRVDNSAINQKSTRDSRKELDNSSFSLSEQLENNLEKTLFNAENERQGMIDLFNSYIEENNIQSISQEDIDNSLDDYDVFDANEEGIAINQIREKYNKVIKEYLQEQGISLEEELVPMVSRKKNGLLQIRREDIQATDKDLEKIFGKQINEEYDEAMKEAENVKFSLDSDGQELSKEQQEFFKDSKIRDEEGKLKVMYHGSKNAFTVFDTKNFGGLNGTAEGFGIYLTDNPTVADDYGNNIMKVYANVVSPATTTDVTTTQGKIVDCIKELATKEATKMVEDGDYDNINDALKDTWISNYTYTYDKSIEQSYKDVAKSIYESSDSDYEIIQELMNGSGNNDYKLSDDFYDTITNTLGFDGIETVWNFKDEDLNNKNSNILLVFKSNQVKNTDNLNPTTNDDIRYSLSEEEELAPTKLPKSYEPFYEFAKEKGFLDDDEKMMIFNGTGKEDKATIKEKISTPKEEYNKTPKLTPEKSQMKKTIDLLDYMFVNRNSAVDNLAKDSGNMNIKYYGDMLNGVSGEAQNEVIYGQTNNQGERIGKSINELFDWANNKGLSDAFNDYLLHYSNIDRHKNGKGSRVHQETSEKMVKKYEKTYSDFKQHAEEVWNFSKNVRDNLLEAGVINKSTYDYLSEVYPHYVPYMEERDITQYIDDSGKLKPVSTIKSAKGGATHTALTPVQEALTKYIYNEKKQIRQNDLYREIYNTLEGEKMLLGADDGTNLMNDNYTGLYRDENGNYLTASFDGELNAIRINDELYNQLNKTMENQIKNVEKSLELITSPLQKISNIRRNLLTTWSPSFLLKNPIKDFGDALINSTDPKALAKNYLPAYGELLKETDLAKQFKALYGSGNAMGEYDSESGLSTGKKAIQKGKGMLQKIANFNEIVELAPRYAEFKATLERGGSVQEAMYNAREVTINFNRGGVITKAMNRNGFTFLNASVQGFDKFIRNFSGQNGAKGVVGALLKATTFGVMPSLFNHLIYAGGDEPDEDYEVLPDYIKDNYYLIKTDNGTFIRIPKGRIPAVFGMVARRSLEYAQGEEDAFEGMGSSIYDQIGFDPFNNHVFAPIQQAYFSGENGKAWYGGDLVPTRLQDKPAGEQYDESTDAISKWVGSKFGISPYKLNYVLDQYTGGIGDMFLPMITEEASSDAETLSEYAIAPIKDQFVVDSTMDNKYAGEFYQTKEDYTIKSNSQYATDEDTLKSKYLNSVSSELSKLYQEKREIQSDTSLSKKQKYEKVKVIQDEINKLAKEGLDGFNQLNKTDNYAIVGDREYYKDGDEWKKVSDKELETLNSLGLDLSEKSSYINSKSDIASIKEDYEDDLEKATDEEKTVLNRQKKIEIINTIKNSNLTDEAKAYLYTRSYGDYATVNALNQLGISMNDYLDLEAQEFTSDKYANGKTVTNSKKKKVINYINSMDLTMEQKVVLAKLKYPSMKTYNEQIIKYIQSNGYLDYDEKKLLLDKLGFKVENNRISW